eukprot:CAMPEP_0119329740 /NCGR_PEP_ID=MMETSP1333-20130426/76635_1 /TAXON_ID=418940 /ORGANISM="Scyphosphaera apsteinii, Strain RCC1455" /LENGTH=60 /DNA_ID=CAMNT_0007338941 /DNA_START=11 /DNA_END=190 /DNA_ORIENTATION=-
MSNPFGSKDYYGILGLASDASEEDIGRAFRRRAKALHPDRNRNAESAVEAAKEFCTIQEA